MKKKLLLCLSAGLLLLLTACGIDLNTDFSANKNFKGSRVIDCTINKSDLQNQDFESLDTVIKTYCPSGMSYKNDSTETQFHYIFTISFSSLKDYTKKVKTCLNFDPVIEYEYGDNPFSTGLSYQENFTSKDLMAWFSECLVKEEFVSESEVENIWNLKQTTFTYDKISYETDHQINIQTLEHLPLDQISIYTEETETGSLEQSIVFFIPKETMDKNGQEIQNYLTGSLKMDKYRYEWDTYETGKKCTITYESSSLSELNTLAKNILHEDVSSEESISIDQTQLFNFHKIYSWQFSFDAYQTASDNQMKYEFYYKPANSTVINGFEETEQDDDGFYRIVDGASAEMSVSIDLIKPQKVSSMQLTTIYHDTESLQREAVISFENILSKKEKKALNQYLEDYAFSKAKYSSKKGTLVLIANGTPEQISSVFDQFFHTSNTLTIQTEEKTFSQSHKTTLKDHYDFSNIMWQDKVNVIYYFISNSDESMKDASILLNDKEKNPTKLSALAKDSIQDSSDLTNFKGEYQYTLNEGSSIDFVYYGGVTDLYGSTAFYVSILVIVLAFFILILLRIRRFRNRQKRG